MRFEVATPTAHAVEADGVRHVRIEDPTGALGIQPRHASFITVLEVSVVVWRDGQAREHYVAVRGGVLSVAADLVSIATREAVTGDDLATLERDVVQRFRREHDAERSARGGLARLKTAAIRRIYEYVRGERAPALPEEDTPYA